MIDVINKSWNEIQKLTKKILVNIALPLILNNLCTKDDNFDLYQQKGIKFQNIYLYTRDSIKIGIWILEPNKIDKNTKYLICLHGVGQNRKNFVEGFCLDEFVKDNIVVIVPDYRSFGDSEGVFDSDDVNFDIDVIYKYCVDKYKSKPDFLGYSFGGAVALKYLAYKKHYQKIILVSTFTTTKEMIMDFKTTETYSELLLQNLDMINDVFDYNNIRDIKYCKPENILILHGKCDNVIHYNHGKLLAKTINCRFILLDDCDHSNFFFEDRFTKAILHFLK